MKNSHRLLLLIICLFLGYALHHGLYPNPDSWNRSNDKENSETKSSSTRAFPRQVSHAETIWSRFQQLEDSRQWLYLIAGVENATPDDFPQLVMLAAGNDKALRIIAYHWAETYPNHLYQTLAAKAGNGDFSEKGFPVEDLGWILFEIWPQKDPKAAIAALSSAGGVPGKHHFRTHTLRYLMKTDPSLGFKLMSKWNHNQQPVIDRGYLKKWAADDPQATLEALLACPQTYDLSNALKDVSRIWADQDPESALAAISSNPGRMTPLAQETILKQWAKRDFEAASAWIAAQDDTATNARLTAALVEVWSKTNHEEALAWTRENLEGQSLNHALAKLVKNRAGQDIESAAALLAKMPSSTKREEAGAAVGKIWFYKDLKSTGLVNSRFVNWYEKLEDPMMQQKILEPIVWDWAHKDRENFMSFLGETQVAFRTHNAMFQAIKEVVKKDPKGTMEWTLSLPAERSKKLFEQAHIAWSILQPKEAQEWKLQHSVTFSKQ